MKYVLIILLLGGVAFFIYWRLRPYLKVMRNVLGVVRDMQRMSAGARAQTPERESRPASEKLIRCSTCGTWLPASRAVALRSSKEAYCSHDCLERSVGKEAKPKTAQRS